MAIIKEKGRIAFMGEIQSGTSQNGNGWARQDIVIDVAGFNGIYRKVALKAGTQLVQDMQEMQVGDLVEFTYQVTAREWNGKWYNNVDLYKIEFVEETQPAPQPAAPAYPPYPQNPQFPQMPVSPNANPVQQPSVPRARRRPAIPSTPQIPANTPMDLQEDDLPADFYPQM